MTSNFKGLYCLFLLAIFSTFMILGADCEYISVMYGMEIYQNQRVVWENFAVLSVFDKVFLIATLVALVAIYAIFWRAVWFVYHPKRTKNISNNHHFSN